MLVWAGAPTDQESGGARGFDAPDVQDVEAKLSCTQRYGPSNSHIVCTAIRPHGGASRGTRLRGSHAHFARSFMYLTMRGVIPYRLAISSIRECLPSAQSCRTSCTARSVSFFTALRLSSVPADGRYIGVRNHHANAYTFGASHFVARAFCADPKRRFLAPRTKPGPIVE